MTQLAMNFIVDTSETEEVAHQFDPEKLAQVEARLRNLHNAHQNGVPLGCDDIGFMLGISRWRVRTELNSALRKFTAVCERLGIEPGDILGPMHHMVEAELWGEAS